MDQNLRKIARKIVVFNVSFDLVLVMHFLSPRFSHKTCQRCSRDFMRPGDQKAIGVPSETLTKTL